MPFDERLERHKSACEKMLLMQVDKHIIVIIIIIVVIIIIIIIIKKKTIVKVQVD